MTETRAQGILSVLLGSVHHDWAERASHRSTTRGRSAGQARRRLRARARTRSGPVPCAASGRRAMRTHLDPLCDAQWFVASCLGWPGCCPGDTTAKAAFVAELAAGQLRNSADPRCPLVTAQLDLRKAASGATRSTTGRGAVVVGELPGRNRSVCQAERHYRMLTRSWSDYTVQPARKWPRPARLGEVLSRRGKYAEGGRAVPSVLDRIPLRPRIRRPT